MCPRHAVLTLLQAGSSEKGIKLQPAKLKNPPLSNLPLPHPCSDFYYDFFGIGVQQRRLGVTATDQTL